MKRLVYGLVIVALVLAACGAPPADQPAVEDWPPEEVPPAEEEPLVEEEPWLEEEPFVEEVTPANVLRATALLGYTVRNPEGESLGSTEDVMIRFKDGQLEYAVLSFGGFFGFGSKWFLVPWEALETLPMEGRFILDVSAETLENAPAVDREQWPDTSDPQWDAEIRAFWEAQGVPLRQDETVIEEAPAEEVAPAEEQAPADEEAIEEDAVTEEEEPTIEATPTPEDAAIEEEEAPTVEEAPAEEVTPEEEVEPTEELAVEVPEVVRLSRLHEFSIRNPEGEELGTLRDLMINWREGRVAYPVLSFGGFLGMGDKWFAIPWGAFRLNPIEATFVLDIDREMLEVAPGFDKGAWPEVANPAWDEEIRAYWEEHQQRLRELETAPELEEMPEVPDDAEPTPEPAPEQ